MDPPVLLLSVLATLIATAVRVGAFVGAWVVALAIAHKFTWDDWSMLVFVGLLAYGLSDILYNGTIGHLEKKMHEREEVRVRQAMEELLNGIKNAGAGATPNKPMVH